MKLRAIYDRFADRFGEHAIHEPTGAYRKSFMDLLDAPLDYMLNDILSSGRFSNARRFLRGCVDFVKREIEPIDVVLARDMTDALFDALDGVDEDEARSLYDGAMEAEADETKKRKPTTPKTSSGRKGMPKISYDAQHLAELRAGKLQSYGDSLGPAVYIGTQQEADRYFDALGRFQAVLSVFRRVKL